MKTPKELHEYLLNLKNKNSQSPHIAEYKRTIREELRSYRSDEPHPPMNSLVPYPSEKKDIVFYSFMEPSGKPKIGEHEYKRLKLSWQSLRKHNTDIEIRFCYSDMLNLFRDPTNTLGRDHGEHFDKWRSLCDDYGVTMYPFHESYTGKEPNAWCIHRWYNLAIWKDED